MRFDAAAPIVVCSPHFDDAVLSCWSVLARLPVSEVVNVFAGLPREGYTTWWDQLCGASSSAQIMQARIVEDRAAIALSGSRVPHNLVLLDAQYRVRPNRVLHATLRRLRPLRWRVLKTPLLRSWLQPHAAPSSEQVIAALRARLPAASMVCAPAAIGSHPDHVVVRDAVLTLVQRGIPVRLYADLPYCLRKGWPSFISGGRAAHDGAIVRQWQQALSSIPELKGCTRAATIVALTKDERAAKRASAARYITQFGALNSGVSGLLDDAESFAYELYWEIAAPVGCGPVAPAEPATQLEALLANGPQP